MFEKLHFILIQNVCMFVTVTSFHQKKIANVEQKALKTLQQLMVSICRYLWSVDVLSK